MSDSESEDEEYRHRPKSKKRKVAGDKLEDLSMFSTPVCVHIPHAITFSA